MLLCWSPKSIHFCYRGSNYNMFLRHSNTQQSYDGMKAHHHPIIFYMGFYWRESSLHLVQKQGDGACDLGLQCPQSLAFVAQFTK